LHKIERGTKIVKHKIAIKIKGSYPINFVGSNGGNEIVNKKSQPRSKDPTGIFFEEKSGCG